MRYKDLLNKEDYKIITIFEFNDTNFVCKKCGDIFNIEESYNKNGSYCKECHKFERKCHHYKDPTIARNNDKKYQKNNRKKTNLRRVNRTKNDPIFNLKERIRTRICNALKYKNWKKLDSITKSIGCSPEELFNHIESLFQPGMNWENRNLWHVDHKRPLSLARSPQELLKLNHYTNLQPLWAKDNLKKSDSY